MAATRKSQAHKWDQESIDPTIVPAITRALKNTQMKKPRCPMPDCEWESYAEPNYGGFTASANERALNRLKRHVRDKHRAYYALATAKPFVIYEEEEEYLHA